MGGVGCSARIVVHARIMDVILIKQRLERTGKKKDCGAIDVMAEYDNRVKSGEMVYAAESETPTENFIVNAIMLHNKVLSDKHLSAIVYAMDASYGDKSPFALLTNLAVLVTSSKTAQNIRWVMLAIQDMLKCNLLAPSDISGPVLDGRRTQNRGLVHLLILKKELKDYLLDDYMVANGFDNAAKRPPYQPNSLQTMCAHEYACVLARTRKHRRKQRYNADAHMHTET